MGPSANLGKETMGYDTKFTGKLTFAMEPQVKALARLARILGKDYRTILSLARDDPRFVAPVKPDWYSTDLMLTDDFDGICWNGTEKCNGMVHAVNAVTLWMRCVYPSFRLCGELEAQGEEPEDRWLLVMDDDGRAKRVDKPVKGVKVTCPECRHAFVVEVGDSYTRIRG